MTRLLSLLFAGLLLTHATNAEQLAVVETEDALTIRQSDCDVVSYRKVSPPVPEGIDSVYQRSGCLHPIRTPGGRSVTTMFPFDHPHQHGVFSAWVRTTYDGRNVDFWNLAGGTGRVLHERVVNKFTEDQSAGFEVTLLHRAVAEPAIDILREHWKITAHATDGTYHCFDLETRQVALTDKPLVVHQFHYGGLALRGLTRWLTKEDRGARSRPALVREPSRFLNDHGSDRQKGNHQHAKWVALGGQFDGQPVSITVLCHPDNFRAPQAARLHPTKPYFVFAPCVDGEFTIDRENPFQSRYRYLVADSEPDSDWIDKQWAKWVD